MQTLYLVNFFKWNTLYFDIPLESSFNERSKDIRCLASKINSLSTKENAHFICNSKDHSNGDILISIDAS
jgi:ribosomal protein S15P/S13E